MAADPCIGDPYDDAYYSYEYESENSVDQEAVTGSPAPVPASLAAAAPFPAVWHPRPDAGLEMSPPQPTASAAHPLGDHGWMEGLLGVEPIVFGGAPSSMPEVTPVPTSEDPASPDASPQCDGALPAASSSDDASDHTSAESTVLDLDDSASHQGDPLPSLHFTPPPAAAVVADAVPALRDTPVAPTNTPVAPSNTPVAPNVRDSPSQRKRRRSRETRRQQPPPHIRSYVNYILRTASTSTVSSDDGGETHRALHQAVAVKVDAASGAPLRPRLLSEGKENAAPPNKVGAPGRPRVVRRRPVSSRLAATTDRKAVIERRDRIPFADPNPPQVLPEPAPTRTPLMELDDYAVALGPQLSRAALLVMARRWVATREDLLFAALARETARISRLEAELDRQVGG